MPMFPGPLSAASLIAIKVTGYSAFAAQLNSRTGSAVTPLKFGITKTAFGLGGNLAYLLLFGGLFSALSDSPHTTAIIFAGAAPVRLGVWAYTIRFFYPTASERTGWLIRASVLGTACSYALDGVMWLISHYFAALPGMNIPVC